MTVKVINKDGLWYKGTYQKHNSIFDMDDKHFEVMSKVKFVEKVETKTEEKKGQK